MEDQILSSEKIDELENFVSKNSKTSWSGRSLRTDTISSFKDCFENFSKTENHTMYDIFGSEGYSSYALYKSKNSSYYIITVSFQDLVGCTEVFSKDFFKITYGISGDFFLNNSQTSDS